MQRISSNTFLVVSSLLKTRKRTAVFIGCGGINVFEAIRKAKPPRFYGNGIIGLIQLFSCSLIENRKIYWHGRKVWNKGITDDAEWFDWLFVYEAYNKIIKQEKIIKGLSL